MFQANSKTVLMDGKAQAVGAGVTDQVVSDPFKITAGGSLHFRVDLFCHGSDFTGATYMLQTFAGKDPDSGNLLWLASKAAGTSITGATSSAPITTRWLVEVAGDQAYLPLHPMGRIVVSSGAGASFTVDDVRITQEL